MTAEVATAALILLVTAAYMSAFYAGMLFDDIRSIYGYGLAVIDIFFWVLGATGVFLFWVFYLIAFYHLNEFIINQIDSQTHSYLVLGVLGTIMSLFLSWKTVLAVGQGGRDYQKSFQGKLD